MCSSQVHIGVKLKKRTVSHHLFSVCLNLISVELNRSQMERKPCWVCFDQLGGSWLFTPAFLLVVSQSRSCVCGYCVMAPSRLLDLHLNLQIHLYSVPKWLITTDTHFLWVTTEEWTAPTSGFTQVCYFFMITVFVSQEWEILDSVISTLHWYVYRNPAGTLRMVNKRGCDLHRHEILIICNPDHL